jgi:hypothetical protein
MEYPAPHPIQAVKGEWGVLYITRGSLIVVWVEFSTLILPVSFNSRMGWLVMIQMQNAQTLQLFTNIIKTESIYKSYQNAKQKAWIQRLNGLIKKGE